MSLIRFFLKTKSGKYFKRVIILICFVLEVLDCSLSCISLVNSNDPNVVNKIIGYILYYLLVFIFFICNAWMLIKIIYLDRN